MPATRPQALSPEEIEAFRRRFDADAHARLAMNAVTKTTAKAVATNRRAVTRLNHTYSHVVKTGAVTMQNKSGRCWMFAGLNLFRMKAAEALNLEDFELSQNFTMFWDKLEKSNYFLESILSTLHEPTDGRLISWLVADPVQDGGQWDMFVNLVEKYGVVPKSIMPETESSSATQVMNERLTAKLREFAARLRAAHQSGEPAEGLRARKPAMLEEIHRILCIHLGEPPSRFLWQWRDKDKEFHREAEMTPQGFFQKFVSQDLDPLVCLIHCPQASKQFNEVYTIDYLGNVVGGREIRYLNVELPVMKAAVIATLKDEVPVWFGCDVGKHLDSELGVMDLDILDYEGLYGVPFELNKAERLDYGASQMTHAMVFTGVDLDDAGNPVKWRVENSWGDKGGEKGFFVMTDPWFDEFNYEVVVEKRYLPADLQALLTKEPVHLPPWDPMGALAR